MRHLWTSHLRRLVLFTMPLLLAVAAPGSAQDPVSTSDIYSITGSVAYTPPAPCNGIVSDTVVLSGEFHMLTQVFPGPTGVVNMHGNLLEVTGTGAPSGARYIAVGSCLIASNSPPLLSYTCDSTTATLGPGFQLIPDASCPHAQIQVNGVVAFNPDGTQDPTASFFTFNPLFGITP